MKMFRLRLAGFTSFGLLNILLFGIVVLASPLLSDNISLEMCVIGTIAINIINRIVAPTLSDRTYRLFYKMEWMPLEKLRETNPLTVKKIEEICLMHKITTPKLGLILDKNPSAFTYGAGKWNGRIIISQGILDFLNDSEVAAVFAHELGHIKNNDFIVMTIASTSLQIIYQIYRNLSKIKGNNQGKGNAQSIAFIAYIAYVIGQYTLLYLSRTREYYADKFAAENTDANILSSALIKISIGILATPEQNDIIKSTQHMNIANIKVSESIGLSYYHATQNKDIKILHSAMMYDIKNPRAKLLEFNSTHPLSGKRIKALMKYTNQPMFDFDKIETELQVDQNKMQKKFLSELFMLCLPYISVALSLAGVLLIGEGQPYMLLIIVIIFALFLIVFNLYKYNKKEVTKTTIAECLGDIYASPIKGKYIELEGTIIGKGVPGYIFTEDMMLQDRSGLMYMDYQAPIPLLGNVFFALTKVKKLVDQKISSTGWFFRGQTSLFKPDIITHENGQIKSYNQLYGMLIPIGLVAIAILIYIK